MKLIIEGSPEEIKRFFGGDVNAKVKVDGLETHTVEKPKLTRADVVAKARRDVEELLSRNYAQSCGDPLSLWFVSDGGTYTVLHECKFIVNREKRTVVALIEDIRYSEIVSRGIAKCAPDDCFNEDIGKAIALRRALKLEVPDEYLNAPQPEGVCIGDIVEWFDSSVGHHKTFGVNGVEDFPDGRIVICGESEVPKYFCKTYGDRVIDDTDREEYRNALKG
jgi:hypothetical protein